MDARTRFEELCRRLGGELRRRVYKALGERLSCVLPRPVTLTMVALGDGELRVEFGEPGLEEEFTLPARSVTVRAPPAGRFVEAELGEGAAVMDVEVRRIELNVDRGRYTFLGF